MSLGEWGDDHQEQLRKVIASAGGASGRSVDQEAAFSYREVDDSARYVEDLRDQAQADSAEGFLREISAWQETASS